MWSPVFKRFVNDSRLKLINVRLGQDCVLYILILAVSNNESTTDWYEKGGKIGVKGGKQDLLIKYKPVRVGMHTARLN